MEPILTPALRSLPEPARNCRTRHQRKKYTGGETRDMRPPDDGAERRPDEREQQLQQDPETDQGRRRDAHELEEQSERQHEAEARAWEQREIRADDRRNRAARTDDRRARVLQRERPRQVGDSAGGEKQRDEAARAERTLGRKAEDHEEQQIADDMQPIDV